MQPAPETTTKVKNKLKFWAQELHDMSGRNRLLFYKDTKTSTVSIEVPGFVALFDLLVERDAALFAPLPDPKEKLSITEPAPIVDEAPKATPKLKENEIQTNHSIPVLNRVLYNLNYVSRTIQEEQGFNILYITFGMLKWREAQNSEFAFAPLILVPVQLSRENMASPYKISMAEDDIVVNPVLQTKLAKDFDIELAEVTNDLTPAQLSEYLTTAAAQVKALDGWEVQERATLGVFNFLTLLLIKDFENYPDRYEAHPIIQALSGMPAPAAPAQKLTLAADLDDLVPPEKVYQIMDADSSQQEAIEAAKQGLSFVLQGPPGTGKSQTIANMIAEFMMAGKKVLFVSQKMAALEVVQNRLNQRGLGEFCLEIHSHKMDKRKVIDNLMRSLSNAQIPPRKADYPAQQQEIKQTRSDLNTYVRQLHQPRFEMGLSLFQAQANLAQLFDAPQLNFSMPGIERIASPTFNKMRAQVREITNYTGILTTYKLHRWKGFQPLRYSIQEQDDLAVRLQESAAALRDFQRIISQAVVSYVLPAPESIQELMQYRAVLDAFTPGIFALALQSAIQNYLVKYKSFSMFFNLQYWRDSADLRAVYRKQTRPAPPEVLSVLQLVPALLKRADPTKLSLPFVEETLPLAELKKLEAKLLDGFKLAEALFDPLDQPAILRQKLRQPATLAADWFTDHAENTRQLGEWANFNTIKKECADLGLADFIAKALERELPPPDWERTFLRRFYLLLTDRLAEAHPALQKFRGTLQSEIIQRFKALDLALIENTPREIQARLYADKPQASWIQSGSAETAILRREYNKKRRIMPLRKLFREIPNSIQSLKPCLMMSPLTVCQLLDPTIYQFDAVIFDEASQIPPEYAIGAFLRSKQVIVAGDRHQLPPTNFFQSIELDETESDEDADENPTFESILNACDSAGFPGKMLNWHYRSKDESLIAYSNYHFYDNRLFTFPNANTGSSKTGLQYIYLPDGVYKKGAGARHNLVEARKVAALVREHLTQTPQLSLGIVAFSVSQRKAIEAELDALRGDPALNAFFSEDDAEPIFVKNLENVQGDERDVIILSVGYGKDETGKMALNFGPINRDGGGRRLNVAVTRARYALKLVTSIEPEDIDLARAASEGAKLLRNYLQVARDGFKAVFNDEKIVSAAAFESPFEEAVSDELTRRGIPLARQVGVSQYRIDLAVIDPAQPGRFLLGIECDGAMYHSAPTARDRDRLRQQVLEGLGWQIYRVWSRDWVQNRTVEIEKLLKVIQQRKEQLEAQRLHPQPEPAEADPVTESVQANAPLLEPVIVVTMPPGAIPYAPKKLPLQSPPGADELLKAPMSLLVSVIQTVVEAEGPISTKLAKQRIVEAWDTRKGARIEAYLNHIIGLARRQNAIAIRGDFLWPLRMSIPPLRIHTSGQPQRDLEEIAPEELTVAIKTCVQSALGISPEDLLRETLKLYGLTATRDHTAELQILLDQLVAQDVLKLENDKISKGGSFEQ